MSLLNVWVSPARALIGVDTAAKAPKHQAIEASKLLHLPHSNLVLASRGEISFLGMVFGQIHRATSTLDFDQLEVDLPTALPVMLAEYLAFAQSHGVDRSGLESEIALVGWSERRQRIAGMAYQRCPGKQEFDAAEIDPWRIGPNADWPKPPPPPDCVLFHQMIARDQVKFMREAHPECAIGGRLLVTELTRDSYSVRTVCELG